MRRLIARLACIAYGHKRGKRIGEAIDIVTGCVNYYCPRCGSRWSRKVKVPA